MDKDTASVYPKTGKKIDRPRERPDGWQGTFGLPFTRGRKKKQRYRMQSTLIRFTDSKFADSYRTGDLYLSSISSFWDLTKDTLPYDPELVKLPEAEIRKRLKEKGAAEGRQD